MPCMRFCAIMIETGIIEGDEKMGGIAPLLQRGDGLIFLPEDREICEELLRSAYERGDGAMPLTELIVAVGRNFLDAPYEAETLEKEGTEELVVNLRAFDCVTFVESAAGRVLALSLPEHHLSVSPSSEMSPRYVWPWCLPEVPVASMCLPVSL